ncbi:hypothetical protein [Bradyrhizobium liaoningense]
MSDKAKLGRIAPREREGMSAAARSLSSPGLDRAIQYSETVVIRSIGRSVLDSPLSRRMTVVFGGRAIASYAVIASAAKQIQSLSAEELWIASLRSQ